MPTDSRAARYMNPILDALRELLSPTAKNGVKLVDQISPFSFKMDSPHRLQSQFPHR